MRRILSTFSSAYSKSIRFTSSVPQIENAVLNGENRIVTVTWKDGTTGRFPLIWLRDCSPDTSTYTISPAMTARNLWMRDFDVRQNMQSMRVEADGQTLHIQWEGEVESRFQSNWLRIRNPTCEKARERRRKVYLFPETNWDRQTIEKNLKKYDYNDVINDDKTLHDFLESVCLDGIAVLTNGQGRGAVDAIGKRIGLIHNTHFGRIFEVSTKSDASNMAYASNGELPFHTDFPSLANPPQLQMLHMIERAEVGGNSLFVDGFHIAEQLRQERPEMFDILSKYSMEYIEEGYDVHEGEYGKEKTFPFKMTARHRVIRTDSNGRANKIQFGNAMRSWFYDCEPEKVQEIYDALKVFTEYCYQDRNILKFQLQNGETVLWANTRVLHTRDGFRNAEGKSRTLEGCYFAWDIVKSRVRQLRSKLQLPQDEPSA